MRGYRTSFDQIGQFGRRPPVVMVRDHQAMQVPVDAVCDQIRGRNVAAGGVLRRMTVKFDDHAKKYYVAGQMKWGINMMWIRSLQINE